MFWSCFLFVEDTALVPSAYIFVHIAFAESSRF